MEWNRDGIAILARRDAGAAGLKSGQLAGEPRPARAGMQPTEAGLVAYDMGTST